MESNTVLWGEMPQPPSVSSEVITSDLVSLLILKGMKVDPPKIHQPCEQDEGLYEVPAECSAMDPIVLHTIQLLEHYKTLQGLIRTANQQTEQQSSETDIEPLLPAPPIPEQPPKVETHGFSYPFRYMEKNFSSFSQGEGLSPPKLKADIAKKILRKSVITMLAHVGYDTSTFYILDTLTDVAEEYIKKFVCLLRVAVDQEALTGVVGFPDVMERVFYDMGIGSMTTLHGFYQSRVVKYHERMLSACNKLQDEYASLVLPVVRPVAENEIIRCGSTEAENEEDIPEIHFPALGEGYSADELQPSLEPGFQMLHSLEQEEQLQNLETEEEINVSDSPSQDFTIHRASADASQQASSSNTSKNRKKKKKTNEGSV